MLNHSKKMSHFAPKQGRSFCRVLVIPATFTIAGLLANILPSAAFIDYEKTVPDTYVGNEYRSCANKLLKAGTTPSTAKICAKVIRPIEFSACVEAIRKHTQITPEDTVYSCYKSHRPEDLAACVVNVSKNTQQTINQAVLEDCGRSLLPLTFARCVIGLRKEINLTPTESLDACKDTGDRVNDVSPGATITPNQYEEKRD
jgi:hypothetical protein